MYHPAWIYCLQVHRATPGAASWYILLSAVSWRRWGSLEELSQHDGGSMDRAAV